MHVAMFWGNFYPCIPREGFWRPWSESGRGVGLGLGAHDFVEITRDDDGTILHNPPYVGDAAILRRPMATRSRPPSLWACLPTCGAFFARMTDAPSVEGSGLDQAFMRPAWPLRKSEKLEIADKLGRAGLVLKIEEQSLLPGFARLSINMDFDLF